MPSAAVGGSPSATDSENFAVCLLRLCRVLGAHGKLANFGSVGLHLHWTSPADLIIYRDADWAGCSNTCKSMSGYAVFLGDNLISWSSKGQPTVSWSSADAQYQVVANEVAESCWLHHLLQELKCFVCAILPIRLHHHAFQAHDRMLAPYLYLQKSSVP